MVILSAPVHPRPSFPRAFVVIYPDSKPDSRSEPIIRQLGGTSTVPTGSGLQAECYQLRKIGLSKPRKYPTSDPGTLSAGRRTVRSAALCGTPLRVGLNRTASKTPRTSRVLAVNVKAAAVLDKPPTDSSYPEPPSGGKKIKLAINGEALSYAEECCGCCAFTLLAVTVDFPITLFSLFQTEVTSAGFGRIGRLVLRAALARKEIEVLPPPSPHWVPSPNAGRSGPHGFA